MAAVSDSSSPFDGFNSPRSRRSIGSRNPSPPTSPWSRILRGGSSSEEIPLSPRGGDNEKADNISKVAHVIENCDGGGNAGGRAKKQAWNKPSNGLVDAGDVMGGLWPALSESAKVSPKSSSDSLKALGEGSGTSLGHAIPSSPQKPNSSNPNPNSNSNSFSPRQKSGNRGGTGPTSDGNFHSPPSLETTQSTSDRANVAGVESSPRDHTQKNNNRETGSRGNTGFQQNPGVFDQPRNYFRKQNGGGSHARRGGIVDGQYQNNFRSRGDQDRSNLELNPHQSFIGRDVHMRQPRPGSRGFIRQGPPTPPPFMSPIPGRPFAGPMGYPELRPPLYYVPALPPEPLGVVPYVTHGAPPPPPGMIMAPLDPHLRAMIVKQIDYYFSPENLCKDIFLRQKMDEQGWVLISVIANFNRVKQLTMYVPFILEAVRSSTVVEVQGDKIRKRNDWMNWLLPPPVRLNYTSSPESPIFDSPSTQVQNVGLEATSNHNARWAPIDLQGELVLTQSSSEQLSRQMQGSLVIGPSNVDEMVQTSSQMGSGGLAASMRRLERNDTF